MATNEPSETSQETGQQEPLAQLPPIKPALRQRLQKCFDHGSKLMEKEKYDYDYANTMFTECVGHDPGNLIYLEVFLGNLGRKYKNNKKGARIRGFGGKANLKKSVSKKDWIGVIRAGLDALKTNPWDVTVLRAMAKACQALHLNESELRYLKNALDANPKDPEVNRHCAQSLARMGQFDMAIACWHRVEENKRNDREAATKISELTLEKTRAQAGFGDPVDLPANRVKHKGKFQEAEVTGDKEVGSQIQLTERQRIEKAISVDPTDVEAYLQLVKLLVEENKASEAEMALQRGLSASGGDIRIRESLEDTQMLRAREKLAIAEQQAKSGESEEATRLAADLKAEGLQREIEVYDSRVQRYPEEPRFRFQLGTRLKKTGRFEMAVESLRIAADDPRCKAVAQLELGECFQHLKDYAAAIQAYCAAVDSADNSHLNVKKLGLYRAGVLATGLRDTENAEKYLSALLELDAGYKDVKARLDKMPSIDDKSRF